MPYTKVNWEDYPSTATPLNADNLNKMDSGIKDLDDVYESLKNTANNGKLVYVNEGALDTLEPSNLDLHVGSPTVVSSLDEMTDTSKIYVYDDDWYSYDGTEWVDRGPFNEPEIVTDKTLSVTDRPADGKAVGDALLTKAEIDGEYESMTVGNAEQLVSNLFEEESGVYTFRTAGGTAEIGDREIDTVIGGSIVWNQLEPLDASAYTKSFSSLLSFTLADGIYTLSVTSSSNNYKTARLKNVITPGHKYFVSVDGCVSGSASYPVWVTMSSDSAAVNGTSMISFYATEEPEYVRKMAIYAPTDGETCFGFKINAAAPADSVTAQLKNMQIIDLTLMFGATIADYIYELEQSTSGAGIQWFKKYFPKDFYAYSAPTIQSVKVGSHDMVGFNQWDEEWELGKITDDGAPASASNQIRSKNYIRAIENTTYYCKIGSHGGNYMGVFCYDADKNFIERVNPGNTTNLITTPENTAYMKFMLSTSYGKVYNDDVCINLSWDGERDGDYEEYKKNSYPLDTSLELRGVPLLDSNNRLTYDGDVYESDGTVTRNYNIVDLGTITPTPSSDVTNGWVFAISDMENYIGVTTIIPKGVLPGYKAVAGAASAFTGGKEWTWRLNPSASSCGALIADPDFINKTGEEIQEMMDGVYFVYPLRIKTTESAEPYQNPQIVDNFGTEEYVDYAVEAGDRDVIIPVGHETKYMPNLKAKLEVMADAPEDEGEYIVTREGVTNTYTPLSESDALNSLDAKVDNLSLNLEQIKAPAILKTLSGDVVSFTDGSDNTPLKSLVINVDPVQAGEGNPSLTNVRQITSGWTGCKIPVTGKNLFGGTLLRDGVKAAIPSATIDETEKTITFGATATLLQSISLYCGFERKFKENTRYTFVMTYKKSSISKASNLRVRYTDDTYDNIPSITDAATKETIVFVSDAGKTVSRFSKVNMGDNTTLYYEESGIFEGVLTADDFVPYVGQTYNITFPDGAVGRCVVDVANRTLTVTDQYISIDGNVEITSHSAGSDTLRPAFSFENILKYGTPLVSGQKIMANWLVRETNANTPTTKVVDYWSIRGRNIAGSKNLYLYGPYGSEVTEAELKQILTATPLQLVINLAAPLTFTLDPIVIRTLLGLNNIWADCGSIEECTYAVDTKTAVEKATIAESPTTDGQYVLERDNGVNAFVPFNIAIPQELPPDPTENGQYYLKLTVQNGVGTLTWETEYSPIVG